MLIEVRAEVEAGPDGSLVSRRDEGAAEDDGVETVVAGGGEVDIERRDLEVIEGVEIVLAPVPHVAEHLRDKGLGACRDQLVISINIFDKKETKTNKFCILTS
eukprot:767132-Hanusia_phi.AAC.3